jgi:hypothetical protein
MEPKGVKSFPPKLIKVKSFNNSKGEIKRTISDVQEIEQWYQNYCEQIQENKIVDEIEDFSENKLLSLSIIFKLNVNEINNYNLEEFQKYETINKDDIDFEIHRMTFEELYNNDDCLNYII